ncbi:MAG TPA: lipid-binding SYLF domain-containing protein [Labilithrix sp.]
MKRLLPIFFLACGGGAAASPGVDPARAEATERVEAASSVVRSLRSDVDGAIPIAAAKSARCVAVVPGLVHGGVLLGARAGRGLVTCWSGGAWSTPSFFVVSGASAGLSAGVQKVDLVMLVMTDKGESALLEGKLQIGADTSITAGPIGRSAQESTDVTLGAPILYWSRANGLFVGLDLSGTVLERDEESMRAIYGDSRDFGVLLHSPKPPPAAVAAFRDEVTRTFVR